MVSTITGFDTNLFLVKQLARTNPNAICIVYAENISQVELLYAEGASYVMTPHFIGSEQIGSFIRKSGLDREQFQQMREKHLEKLRSQILQ
jgi:voltage-gated potassium channel Kch